MIALYSYIYLGSKKYHALWRDKCSKKDSSTWPEAHERYRVVVWLASWRSGNSQGVYTYVQEGSCQPERVSISQIRHAIHIEVVKWGECDACPSCRLVHSRQGVNEPTPFSGSKLK